MELGNAIVVLFIAGAGYTYCAHCVLIKYQLHRDSGQKLYLASLASGLAFFLLTYALYLLQEFIWVKSLNLKPLVLVDKDDQVAVISVVSFVFSGIITYSLNRIPRLKAACLVKAWERDDIDSICSEAITNFKLISISLDNRKVYIGLVFDSLEPDKEGYLTILPFYSGHRDIENLEMVLVKKYTSVYNLLERLNDQPPGQEDEELESQLKDYRIVIPRERIATLNISANSLYKEMEEPSKQI